ncbi:Ubiquitin-conjugating enzyme E2 14 [Morella rubra]|uniref:Ubiquitin-conjugating enzyme E2 14 n=1 Tax=Morella rubra TaxID=262757 RepID=A0A6A1W2D6_9ROSI|nr:Ubiquitin-conjugating enzyme E2 14 [Morella rubra]KAB1217928.1 Ubiquitin-conjugating enzyme E2 14 [Morella rubra]
MGCFGSVFDLFLLILFDLFAGVDMSSVSRGGALSAFPCCSDGGFFNAIMSFPSNYPVSPPTVRFTSELWHPNVYLDGRVCISILHPPGEDPNGYEHASERWTPVHTVESIVLSIISMLSSPNDESPANVDAAKQWREKREDFRRKVSRCVRKSQEML